VSTEQKQKSDVVQNESGVTACEEIAADNNKALGLSLKAAEPTVLLNKTGERPVSVL
jgi:hypothetical protein